MSANPNSNLSAVNMGANIFRQEFEAQFTSIGNYRAYLSFDRDSNLRDVRFEPLVPLIWSLDFNVDPMCMLLMQRTGDTVHVLEEIVLSRSHGVLTQVCDYPRRPP